MINWNDPDQVGDAFWGEQKEIEDHIVPQPKEHDGNSFSKFERCSRNQRCEDDCGTKNNFLVCNVKNGSSSNTNQEFNDASIDMDSWPDLPNLGMAFGGCFNDEIAQDSVVTGLVTHLADTVDLKSMGGFMEEYKHSGGILRDKASPSLSRTSILLSSNEMQLDGEPDFFGNDENENDNFMDYDWAIEDFGDLDKMFRNHDSIFGNEMIANPDTFLNASAELISCTSQSIPDIPISREQDWEEGYSSHHLGEHSNVEVNHLKKGKADIENQTFRTMKKKQEEKGKGGSSQAVNNISFNKNQQLSSPRLQASTVNPLSTFQSQPLEQPNTSHPVMLTDYGYPTYQLHGMPFPPQIHPIGNHLNFSKHQKSVVTASKPLGMTPREKIEKLRRRQQMQAMLAIQKQREQYNHQISGADEAPSMAYLQNNQNQGLARATAVGEEHARKLSSSDASSLADQDQSQMISSSLGDRSVEETIYFQLLDAMGKLDMNVRLSIRDSLYRLARSAMERQKNSDRSSTNKSNQEEDKISTDEESNNKNRYSRLLDCEAVTNPIDRIVAHLLFHNPSGSSVMPMADAGMSMAATSM
ncbi:protein LNK2 isoform X2 [Phalaenopsis equestris]|uniref:protein LNK2 isoform X2 n=1 Tax=Phalaenopsis equestris TaxID=78828 RepID=UPI0009E43B3C|nr:protein LNK2 isoform X2 [Phalaenopsis equestris]